MSNPTRRLRGVAFFALLASLSMTSLPSMAATKTVLALGSTFIPGSDALPDQVRLAVTQGDSLQFKNLDLAQHNVTSVEVDANGVALFQSPTIIATNVAVDVSGVSSLSPGSYPFYCTHHPGMLGTLFVESP